MVRIDVAQRRARQIALAGLDLGEMCLAFDDMVRANVEYVVASWSTHDPATTLFTSCTMTGVPKDPEGEARLFACEFRDDEPSTYRCLIAEGRTVAILSDVTDGVLSRASRFRELFEPVGITDELRAVLRADGTAWGSATLLRAGGLFDEHDAEYLAAIGPWAGHGIRLALLRAAARQPELSEEPPGIIEARPDGSVCALTAPAQRWIEDGGLPLLTAVNVLAAATRSQQEWPGAASRVLVSDGCVLSLHAATMTTEGNSVAVIVDRARPAEVRAMLGDAYGLTRRQREVLGHLLLGPCPSSPGSSGSPSTPPTTTERRSTNGWACPTGPNWLRCSSPSSTTLAYGATSCPARTAASSSRRFGLSSPES